MFGYALVKVFLIYEEVRELVVGGGGFRQRRAELSAEVVGFRMAVSGGPSELGAEVRRVAWYDKFRNNNNSRTWRLPQLSGIYIKRSLI